MMIWQMTRLVANAFTAPVSGHPTALCRITWSMWSNDIAIARQVSL
jgi:hypothetical protein